VQTFVVAVMTGQQSTVRQRAHAYELYKAAHKPNWAAIARTVGSTPKTVKAWVQHYEQTGLFTPSKRVRRSKLDKELAAEAVRLVQQRAIHTSARVAQQIAARSGGVKVSDRTVRRLLRREGLTYSKRTVQSLKTEAQKRARVAWALVLLEADFDWGQVMMTDSKMFGMFASKSSQAGKAWGTPGARQAAYMVKHPQQVHVYGGVSLYGKTPLIIATGTTGQKSKHLDKKGQPCVGVGAAEYQDLLRASLLPEGDRIFASKRGMEGKWILQQDGARPHTAKATKQLLETLMPDRVLPWPANSADLSWIENVWAWVETEVRRRPLAANLQEFIVLLQDVWDSVPDSFLQNAVKGMNNRLRKCIERNGESIGK
jgi:transposase